MADTTLPGVFQKGVAASRPAANAVAAGTVYSATDTGVITQSDGVSTWSTWATISSGMADPMTTRGDMIIRNAANATARLGRGSAAEVLTSDGTDIAWAAPAASGIPATIFDAAGDIIVASAADTAARLAIGAAGGHVSRINGAVAWNSGTAFPTAATGDRYWRTDLGMEFFYDGTRWRSINIYSTEWSVSNISASAQVGNYSGLWKPTYDVWLIEARGMTYVASANTGSAFWTVNVKKASDDSVLGTFNTGAVPDTNATFTGHVGAIGAVSTEVSVYANADKTSTPGNLYCGVGLYYQIIAT